MIETISVVIPAYNRATFICRAVESVLDQTFRDFEVIVVDDGSTDNTSQVLEKYKRLPNFQYLYQANKGRSIARNEGSKVTTGNWIMYLDSDDYLEKNTLQILYNLAKEAKDSDIVYGNFVFFRNDGPAHRHYGLLPGKALNKNLLQEMLEGKLWLTQPGTYLIQKTFAHHAGGFCTAFEPSEDLEFTIRILLEAKVSYVPDIVLHVERHAENTGDKELQHAIVKIFKHYLLKNNNWKQKLSPKELKRATCALKFRIANASYELNDHSQSFIYYSRLVKSKPSVMFNGFILKQIFASMVPWKLKKMIKRI